MPTLEFKGEQHIYAHHLTVPYRPLVPDAAKSALPQGAHKGTNISTSVADGTGHLIFSRMRLSTPPLTTTLSYTATTCTR